MWRERAKEREREREREEYQCVPVREQTPANSHKNVYENPVALIVITSFLIGKQEQRKVHHV